MYSFYVYTLVPIVLGACQSACQNTIDRCKTIFNITGHLDSLPDCAAISPLTNLPVQPDGDCNAISQKSKERLPFLSLSHLFFSSLFLA